MFRIQVEHLSGNCWSRVLVYSLSNPASLISETSISVLQALSPPRTEGLTPDNLCPLQRVTYPIGLITLHVYAGRPLVTFWCYV